MSDDTLYCTYCGGTAVLIRTVGEGKRRRKEYLCNECIGKDERGELSQNYQTVDNL